MDLDWWNYYWPQVRDSDFDGEMYSTNETKHYPVKAIPVFRGGNSGAGAIALAQHLGAGRVVLLGYDCQHTDGKKHHHGDHPPKLGNAASVNNWPKQFRVMKEYIGDLEVINATRQTALDIWPCESLETVLANN